MFDLPSDLPRLRILERYVELQLAAIRAAIETAEAAGAEELLATARRTAPAVGWKVETQRMLADGRPWRVHHGDCGMGKGRACTREDARRLLAEGVDACPYCRPEIELRL